MTEAGAKIEAVAVVRDLMFSSKIGATARAVGTEAATVPSAEALGPVLDAGAVRLVMVDMGLDGDAAVEAIRMAAGHDSQPVVVAFYSHVQAGLRDAARQAGAGVVMPRSAFTAQLETLLTTHRDGEPAG